LTLRTPTLGCAVVDGRRDAERAAERRRQHRGRAGPVGAALVDEHDAEPAERRPGRDLRPELRRQHHRRGHRERGAQPHAQRRAPRLEPGGLADEVLDALEVDLHRGVSASTIAPAALRRTRTP
jgi:hypothetical protein